MNFTKENFIKLWRQILPLGFSVNLEVFEDGFGYFEMAPYHEDEKIRYNINRITNTNEGLVMSCTVRLHEFNIGATIVGEFDFLRHAQNVSLYGRFNDDIIDLCNKFKGL